MAEVAISVGNIDKLNINSNNYGSWSTRMKFYLLGQDLWAIVDGDDATQPTEAEQLKKWKVKAGKAMYVLTMAVEDDLLQRIKDAKTPKEAWDTLTALFAKTNDAKL